jgi:rare lipoprotein A
MKKTAKLLFLLAMLFSFNEAQGAVRKYKATATWYDCCNKTANGERFHPYGFTVAHRTFPFGTVLRLTNEKTGKSIIVRVNDRGPYIRGRDIDVTKGGAIALGFFHSGTAKLLIEVLEKGKQNDKSIRKIHRSNIRYGSRSD